MPGSALEIRIASVDDVAELSEIGQKSFRTAYAGSCSDDDLSDHLTDNFGETAIRDELRLVGRTYLLASVHDRAAGMAKLRDGVRPAEVPESRVIEIQQFYVSPDQQREGLGGQLMNSVLAWAKAQAFNGVWLSVWEYADWAIGFYNKHEFMKIGTTDFLLGSTVYNDFLMWRPITRAEKD